MASEQNRSEWKVVGHKNDSSVDGVTEWYI